MNITELPNKQQNYIYYNTLCNAKQIKYNFTFSIFLLYGDIFFLANTAVVMQVTIPCAPNPIILYGAVTTESKLY